MWRSPGGGSSYSCSAMLIATTPFNVVEVTLCTLALIGVVVWLKRT